MGIKTDILFQFPDRSTGELHRVAKVVMEEVTKRVERGAAWLDVHQPGWVNEIDLTKLNLDDPFKCVLGQVFERAGKSSGASGYELGLARFIEIPSVAEEYSDSLEGFSTDHGFNTFAMYNVKVGPQIYPIIKTSYSMLDAAWFSLIASRRPGEPFAFAERIDQIQEHLNFKFDSLSCQIVQESAR